jgi:predicted DNA-binding transcriptional regulator AlpA
MNTLPTTGYLREWQLIGDPKRGIPAILPFKKTTLWRRVKFDPVFPKPIKLGPRIKAWKVEEVLAYIATLNGEGGVA